jgi:parallel beta-helix repeat protein
MPIICWGNLAKSATETTTIDSEISDYIETHDENPNAHMGADYSLGAHRLSVEMDHLPYSIRNKLLYPQGRTYKAIVDPAGNGDVTDIQTAIDYVNSIGGGSILIKAGTYTLNSDLTLYSHIHLCGEDADTTIIDFNGAHSQILAIGTGGTHKSDIEISGLQIKNSYNGNDCAVYFQYVDDSEIHDDYFQLNYDSDAQEGGDIRCSHCLRIKIERNRASHSGQFYAGNYCVHNLIQENYINYAYQTAISEADSYYFKMTRNHLVNCVGTCFESLGYLYNAIFAENTADSFGSVFIMLDAVNGDIYDNIITGNTIQCVDGNYGVYIFQEAGHIASDNIVSNNIISDADNDGIRIRNSDYNVVLGNRIFDSSNYGINIYDSGCLKNIVVGNQCIGNVSGGINDVGTTTELGHNIVS